MIHANRSTLKVFQAVFALSSFVLAVATPAATIYKWTDQRGETHYSDKKPAGNQWEIVDESKISVIPSTVPNPPPTPGTATNTATNGDDQLAFDRALAERRQRLLNSVCGIAVSTARGRWTRNWMRNASRPRGV